MRAIGLAGGRALRALSSLVVGTGIAATLSCGGGGAADGCDESTGPCPLSVDMDPTQATVLVGSTATLTASPINKNGPIDNAAVSWTSEQPAIAQVTGNGRTATVSGKAGGNATIRATSRGVSGTVTITVTTVPVATLTLSDHQVALFVGGTKQITATARDQAGNALQNRPTTWSTLDASIASVASTGTITAITAGSTKIVASVEGRSDTAVVVVAPVPVASVTIAPATGLDILVGQTGTLTATARDASNNILTGRTVTWSSANPGVATVAATTGVVTGVSAGSTTVTATVEGKSATADVKISAGQTTQFTVTTSVTPVGAGTVTGGGTFAAGNSVTLAATPSAGFQFTNWTEGATIVSASANYTFTLTASRDLVANFAPVATSTFKLTVTGTGFGTGTVSSVPAGISCTITAGVATGTCAANFASGASVTLTATTAAGGTSSFGGWGGACSGGTCSVAMSQDRSVTATFNGPSAMLSVAVTSNDPPGPGSAGPGNGTVTSNPAGISCKRGTGTCSAAFAVNANVTLTPAPDAFNQFKGWSGACTGTGGCSVPMTAAKSVGAVFDPIYYLVTANTTGSGAVYSGYLDIECSSCAQQAGGGKVIDFAGHPAIGWVFTGFTGGACSGTATCLVTLTGPITVTANFLLQPPPTVTTSSATSVARTSATLNGTVIGSTAGGPTLSTTVSYQWGTAPASLGNVISLGTQPLNGVSKSWPAALSGLTPNTTYYFRLSATNPTTGVPTFGSTLSFTTPP